MKAVLVALLLSGICFSGLAQPDLSGAYGYSRKPEGNTGNDKQATGPSGRLALLKMEGTTYRFWLDVTVGWPSYERGETDGTIRFVNDTASFDNTFENAELPCILKFQLSGSAIRIQGGSASFNCGFGNEVRADGNYPRLKPQPVLDNKWLKQEYPEAPMATVISSSAELFQDENCMVPFSPKKFFVRDDKILNIAETQRSMYTENISPTGVFTWGWMRKPDVKNISRN